MCDCLIYSVDVVVDEIFVIVVGLSTTSFLHFIGENASGWKPQLCKKYQGKNAAIFLQLARFLRAATQLNRFLFFHRAEYTKQTTDAI